MEPILYILVRNDLDSLNPGKMAAQTAHAGTLLEHVKFAASLKYLHVEWKKGAGFGTTIVLSASLEQIERTIQPLIMNDCCAGYVVDPTYPYVVSNEISRLISKDHDTSERVLLENNKMLLCRRELTCGFIFGDKSVVGEYVKDFPLYP